MVNCEFLCTSIVSRKVRSRDSVTFQEKRKRNLGSFLSRLRFLSLFLRHMNFPRWPPFWFSFSPFKSDQWESEFVFTSTSCARISVFLLCGFCFPLLTLFLKLQDHHGKLLYLFHRYCLLPVAAAGEIHSTSSTFVMLPALTWFSVLLSCHWTLQTVCFR